MWNDRNTICLIQMSRFQEGMTDIKGPCDPTEVHSMRDQSRYATSMRRGRTRKRRICQRYKITSLAQLPIVATKWHSPHNDSSERSGFPDVSGIS